MRKVSLKSFLIFSHVMNVIDIINKYLILYYNYNYIYIFKNHLQLFLLTLVTSYIYSVYNKQKNLKYDKQWE